MNSRNAIQQELKDLRSSLPLTNTEQPVFTVPEGYFENFAASVLAKVKSQPSVPAADELADLSPVLAAIPKQTPYHVPENYFQHLATDLPAFVKDEALPEFLTHTKQMPYTVPTGYFDGLAAQVAAKLTRPKAKVISLSSRVVRYAAAAVLTGVIAVTAFLSVTGNRSGIDPSKQPDAWVAQKLKNVPNRDLEAFLKTTDTGFNSKELAKGSGEVRQMLRDVSTTELDAFLKTLPAEAESTSMN